LFSSEMGLPPPALSTEAADLLMSYSFPGNVRELKNLIERALIGSGGEPIQRSHFQLASASAAPLPRAVASATTAGLPLNLEEAEQALIQRALEQTQGNVAEAARLLGVNRSRIYRRFPQAAES